MKRKVKLCGKYSSHGRQMNSIIGLFYANIYSKVNIDYERFYKFIYTYLCSSLGIILNYMRLFQFMKRTLFQFTVFINKKKQEKRNILPIVTSIIHSFLRMFYLFNVVVWCKRCTCFPYASYGIFV